MLGLESSLSRGGMTMFDLLRRSLSNKQFKVRSPARDGETDQTRVSAIAASIDNALLAAEAEAAGLGGRLADVTARAAVTFGNDSDEYRGREALDERHQNLFSDEIANAERRLKELTAQIGHFKFMKTVLSTRFPDFRAPAVAANG